MDGIHDLGGKHGFGPIEVLKQKSHLTANGKHENGDYHSVLMYPV